jgi:DNA-binding MarR family transcriptional regulator
MKYDLTRRFGFLVTDVAKAYGHQFDALARERIGLSRAQVKLLSVLAMNEGRRAVSQAELAQQLELTPMAIAGLCDRMEAAGWVRRQPSATDRRVNEVHLAPRAQNALDAAFKLSDALTAKALAGLTAAERAQLIALLAKARNGLLKDKE